jgi:hypothetical protein
VRVSCLLQGFYLPFARILWATQMVAFRIITRLLSWPMMDPVFLSCLPVESNLSACRNTFVCLLPVTSYNAVVCPLKSGCLLETKPSKSVTTLLAGC